MDSLKQVHKTYKVIKVRDMQITSFRNQVSDHRGRTVHVAYGRGQLEHWVHGFKSLSRQGCMTAFFCAALYCVRRDLEMV